MRFGAVCFLLLSLAIGAPADAVDLRMGSKGLPAVLGNPYTGNGSPGNFLWTAMFDGLTALDKNGAISPALATSWKLVTPTSWQFTLRKGVAFSNGEPFNAKAVMATLAWIRMPEGARMVIGPEIRGIVGAEAVDDYTVTISTAKPDPILPARLSGIMIVAPGAWAELGPDGFSQTPFGTGSFAVKDWGKGARVTLEAFTNSWRRPKVDRLIIVNLPEDTSRVQALLSGQVDIAGNIGVDDIDTLEAAGMLMAVGPGMAVTALAFKTEGARNPALKDPRVRQAINYAIDKDSLNKALLRGLAPPAGQPASRGVNGYNPDVAAFPYDPAKAKALLDEAGYGSGFPLRFDVMVDRFPADRGIYQTVQQSLAKIGVQMELHTITVAAWLEAYNTGGWDKDTDGFLLSTNSAPYNDVARPLEIYSCLRPKAFFCDKGLTQKLVAANEQIDADKRLAQLNELAKLYHDAAPMIYLNEQFDLFGVSRKLEGFALINRTPAYDKISVRK